MSQNLLECLSNLSNKSEIRLLPSWVDRANKYRSGRGEDHEAEEEGVELALELRLLLSGCWAGELGEN